MAVNRYFWMCVILGLLYKDQNPIIYFGNEKVLQNTVVFYTLQHLFEFSLKNQSKILSLKPQNVIISYYIAKKFNSILDGKIKLRGAQSRINSP